MHFPAVGPAPHALGSKQNENMQTQHTAGRRRRPNATCDIPARWGRKRCDHTNQINLRRPEKTYTIQTGQYINIYAPCVALHDPWDICLLEGKHCCFLLTAPLHCPHPQLDDGRQSIYLNHLLIGKQYAYTLWNIQRDTLLAIQTKSTKGRVVRWVWKIFQSICGFLTLNKIIQCIWLKPHSEILTSMWMKSLRIIFYLGNLSLVY